MAWPTLRRSGTTVGFAAFKAATVTPYFLEREKKVSFR